MPRRWFSAARWSVPRLPHCIEAELISALGRGTNLDVAAADQSRPSATRTARPIHPMRCIFIPHLGKIGLAYFSPCECEVAHTSRGINGGSKQRARMGERGGERLRGVYGAFAGGQHGAGSVCAAAAVLGVAGRAAGGCDPALHVLAHGREVIAWCELRDISGGRRAAKAGKGRQLDYRPADAGNALADALRAFADVVGDEG
jgi:hypothetical protein